MADGDTLKAKDLRAGGSAMARYRSLVYGDVSTWTFLRNETLICLLGGCPGALGLVLRRRCWRRMFGSIGRGVLFGRNVTLRHPQKIHLGDGVIIDDNVVLDAKGTTNRGIRIGNDVYIGRNTIVYCKNGDIELGDRVNVSSNCEIFSSNRLVVGPDTVVAAYSYLLSGGSYDIEDRTPFSLQAGTESKGPLEIGENCWIGAHVTVVDGASIGTRSVIAAGAVVVKPVASGVLAGGVPARVIREIG